MPRGRESFSAGLRRGINGSHWRELTGGLVRGQDTLAGRHDGVGDLLELLLELNGRVVEVGSHVEGFFLGKLLLEQRIIK